MAGDVEGVNATTQELSLAPTATVTWYKGSWDQCPSLSPAPVPSSREKGGRGWMTGHGRLASAIMASCWQGPALLLSSTLSCLLGSIYFSVACILAFPPCFPIQAQNVPQCLAPVGRDPTISRLCRCPCRVPLCESEALLGSAACQCLTVGVEQPWPPHFWEVPMGAALRTRRAGSVLEVQPSK